MAALPVETPLSPDSRKGLRNCPSTLTQTPNLHRTGNIRHRYHIHSPRAPGLKQKRNIHGDHPVSTAPIGHRLPGDRCKDRRVNDPFQLPPGRPIGKNRPTQSTSIQFTPPIQISLAKNRYDLRIHPRPTPQHLVDDTVAIDSRNTRGLKVSEQGAFA